MSIEVGVTPRRAATRALLMEAARAVIAERGVQGASVEDICERAGFTRGAFYSNFGSKDDLATALMGDIARSRIEAATDAIERIQDWDSESLDKAIEIAVRAFVQAQPQQPEEVLVLSELQLYAIRAPAVRQEYLGLIEGTMPMITDLIATTVDRFGWQFRTSPGQALALLHAVFDHSAMQALLTGDEPNPERMVQDLSQLMRALIVRSHLTLEA